MLLFMLLAALHPLKGRADYKLIKKITNQKTNPLEQYYKVWFPWVLLF